MQDPDAPTEPERSGAAHGRGAADRTPTPSPSRLAARPGSDGTGAPTIRTGMGSSVRGVELVGGPGEGSSARTRALPLPAPGDLIDSFEVEQAIGSGGMGAVFLARDTRLDRHVALKVLPPEQADDPEVVQRFYQEGRSAARLDHENIARVYAIGHDGRYHYIAFEHIEGTTIRQRVERNGPCPVAEAIDFTLQIADALVHAAERGVVHRDIKPSNIIVTPQGRAKLVDMGLARRFERGRDEGLTQSGMTLGTFDYISPEQARDPRDVDVRSDLYSLGCTLFHMLTGRPPFPEGTVLQKLIQHQEEPPPEVRAINPAVPAELAAVVVKLMAKDRDRRYQTPEQLVRDLVSVAGSLGLRPAGPTWPAVRAPASWERHLVWGLPVAVLGLIVGALFWFGQDTSGGASSSASSAEAAPKVVNAPSAPVATTVAPAARSGDPANAESAPPALEAAAPRTVVVDSTMDLLAAIASAPPRTTLVLSDDGPYFVGLDPSARSGDGRLVRRDLTIRAEVGVRPVIRMASRRGPVEAARTALLDLAGGRVVLDGLEFVLEADDRGDGLAALRAEDTELTVRRCLFRREGMDGPLSGRAAAVVVRSSGRAAFADDRPPAVLLDQCHLDGGQTGVLAVGPVDLALRDCTLGGCDPAVWFDNAGAANPVVADLALRHVSLLAGAGPVFRFDRTEARVRVDDSVVAPSAGLEAVLVAIDLPAGLDWRGRSNLYAGLATYLRAGPGRPAGESIDESSRWAETTAGPRESNSTFASGPVWGEPDPTVALTQDPANPSRAFRLATAAHGAVGARSGPFGSLPPADVPRVATATPPRTQPGTAAPALAGDPPGGGEHLGGLPEMPMAPAGAEERVPSTPGPAAVATTPGGTPAPEAAPSTTASPPAVDAGAVLQTVEQLLAALKQPGAQGGTLRVAADADWAVPAIAVHSSGAWRLTAAPGPRRPRLRFVPPEPDSARAATPWVAMFELTGGALALEGFDLVLARAAAPRQGRWTAFAGRPATELSLTNCTVTVEDNEAGAPSAVVAVAADSADDPDPNAPDPAPAVVRFTDSLVRTGADLVDVSSGRRLVLELSNVVAATGGCLVHAHGLPRGHAAGPIRLSLRQVTARTEGGLVQLESATGEPELPVADVSVHDSILAGTPHGTPLLRVDGQDALASLRDRVRWEGRNVAYHQVDTYRRDQSSQVGSVPTLYDRQSWTVAVGARESDTVHGDLKFARDWGPEHGWRGFTRADAELASDSPAHGTGPDLSRIPIPPS